MQDAGITSSLTQAGEERAILPSTQLAKVPPARSHTGLHPGAFGRASGQARAVPPSPRDKPPRCPWAGCSTARSSHGRQVPRDPARSCAQGSTPAPPPPPNTPPGSRLPSQATAQQGTSHPLPRAGQPPGSCPPLAVTSPSRCNRFKGSRWVSAGRRCDGRWAECLSGAKAWRRRRRRRVKASTP